ncbi:hypothetical protein HX878_22390 [Pseudomonas veronii]|uniref:hypothetical protein n=1 Tax=Pseudomonas veronii TaxID=76761 RepID=UPI0015A4E2A2|nr:hypothetical protein [Pseudomonas veronii]NWD57477.1 hypothetical protein [Pseudomonas veronii]
MNQYLVEVSVKSTPDSEFCQRMLLTFIDEQHLLLIFSTYVLVKGMHLNGDGMVAFYSAEGIYPLARLLVLDQPATDGHAEWFDTLLSSLPTPVRFIPPVRLPHNIGAIEALA